MEQPRWTTDGGAHDTDPAMSDDDGTDTAIRRLRRMAIVTTIGLSVLVVAGGAVRLTGSGLGCDDWPNCNEERFIDVSSMHAAIEQLNRIFSGLIGIPTLLTAIGAFRVPRALKVRGPALGILVTVLANAVVGGMAVRQDLHPALVQSHFLLAMASIALGVIVIFRCGQRSGESVDATDRFPQLSQRTDHEPGTVRLTWVLAVLTGAALVTGTVVTGTGPHAGDETARRFGFDISEVARIHGATVIATLLVALVLARRLRTAAMPDARATNLLSAWIFAGLLQGAIGYTQYFTGVPELLVGIHIAGATVLWILTVSLVLRMQSTTSVPASLRMTDAPVGAA